MSIPMATRVSVSIAGAEPESPSVTEPGPNRPSVATPMTDDDVLRKTGGADETDAAVRDEPHPAGANDGGTPLSETQRAAVEEERLRDEESQRVRERIAAHEELGVLLKTRENLDRTTRDASAAAVAPGCMATVFGGIALVITIWWLTGLPSQIGRGQSLGILFGVLAVLVSLPLLVTLASVLVWRSRKRRVQEAEARANEVHERIRALRELM